MYAVRAIPAGKLIVVGGGGVRGWGLKGVCWHQDGGIQVVWTVSVIWAPSALDASEELVDSWEECFPALGCTWELICRRPVILVDGALRILWTTSANLLLNTKGWKFDSGQCILHFPRHQQKWSEYSCQQSWAANVSSIYLLLVIHLLLIVSLNFHSKV